MIFQRLKWTAKSKLQLQLSDQSITQPSKEHKRDYFFCVLVKRSTFQIQIELLLLSFQI